MSYDRIMFVNIVSLKAGIYPLVYVQWNARYLMSIYFLIGILAFGSATAVNDKDSFLMTYLFLKNNRRNVRFNFSQCTDKA